MSTWRWTASFTAKDVLRKNDKAFKENGLTGDETDAQLIKLMAQHPTLLQRPIGVVDSARGLQGDTVLTMMRDTGAFWNLTLPKKGRRAEGWVSTPEQYYTIRRSKNVPLWRCGRLSIGPGLRRGPCSRRSRPGPVDKLGL